KDGVVEGLVGVIVEVVVGIALNDGEPVRHAGIDLVALKLDAAPVDAFALGQELQQFSIAATDVENAGACFHHLGDQHVIDARRFPTADQLKFVARAHPAVPSRAASPRFTAAALRKPRTVAKNIGSSSRNAS